MGINWLELLVFLLLLVSLSPFLGTYIAYIFGEKRGEIRFARGLEKLCYRACNIDANEEMSWTTYAKALFLFNLLGFVAVFLLQVLQYYLPLNPEHLRGVPFALAFNTAISFVTNTNWQAYAGETTLSYATQMCGLAVQNFISAATGMCVLLALIRGLARKKTNTIGNFWVDLVRTIIYLLLPLSILLAIFLVSQGVVQTLSPYLPVTTVENESQTIPLGPVASQIAIKQLGTNGGGFFNANSSHPFENPTPLSNFFEIFAIVLIPAALPFAYGSMVGSKKQGALLFIVMLILWGGGLSLSLLSESIHNPILDAFPIWEGKELRFGISNSLLWSSSTTATANGSVNAMLSSLSPIAGGIALFNIMLGELIFGGIGVGLSSMLMFCFLTVFICGLMIGRTPEYLGKKIEKAEMKWVIMAVLLPGVLTLLGSSISLLVPEAFAKIGSKGPHGLSELLYAFASTAGNNGSAFSLLDANTNYYNITLGIVMLLGRIAIVLPTLAIAGLLAKKKKIPSSQGTFATTTPLFGIILISVILIVGALTFFPALSLGPLVEHLLMIKGRSF